MWFRLFRAEWIKIIGNRWVSGCMIWIFPLFAILFTVLTLLAAIFSSSFREGLSSDPMYWTEIAIVPWFIPNNPLGLGLLLGFTAVLFAGEYQWNTWKMIVPRSKRIPLIIMKFFTVGLFIVFAFTLMSILLTLGMGLVSWVAGASYGVEEGGLRQFAKDYSLQMLYAFVSTIIAAGYASVAAMITRSILGSVITSIVFTIGQTASILPLFLAANLLDTDIILHAYRFTPNYNLLNLFTWLVGDTPEGIEMPSGAVVVDNLLFSEVMLICWVIGLVALTAYLFHRQDITN